MQISSSLAADALVDARRIAGIATDVAAGESIPILDAGATRIADLVEHASAEGIDPLLADFLPAQRWYASKGSTIESARVADVVAIPGRDGTDAVGHLATIDVRYADGTAPERYAAALVARPADQPVPDGSSVLARVHAADGEFLLVDAPTDPALVDGIIRSMRGGSRIEGAGATLVGGGARAIDDAIAGLGQVDVRPLSLESSNTSVLAHGEDGTRHALKLVRRHDGVLDPSAPTQALDVWKGAYLTNEAGYANTPAVLGSLDHVGSEGLPRTVAVLTEFVPNDGDSWAHALEAARDTIGAARSGASDTAVAAGIDDYGAAARNHGRRLGELHVALSSGGAQSEFRGVKMGADQVEARLARLQLDTERTVEKLRSAGHDAAADLLEARMPDRIDEVRAAADELVPIDAIHTHGDFHLGQMLRTGDDVQLIDLEGAPALPLAERWQRTVALGDVARQRSSYEYAAHQSVLEAAGGDAAAAEALRPVADKWAARAKDEFLTGWLDATSDRRFRHARTELAPELREAELSNALYETNYELGSRPDWVDIPLGRITRMLDQ